MTDNNKKVSVVIPVFNEEWCIFPLFGKIQSAMASQEEYWELIFVNDGSTDGTRKVLIALVEENPNVKAISFRRNFGLTQALQAGIDHASGNYIVTISGDLQNEPREIPLLLDRLRDGFDVCAGWRSAVKGTLTRSRPRRFLNWVISKISGVKLHDYECILRAYRSEILTGMRLYGDLDRYIPVYASWRGGRITEIKVNQLPRSHGHARRESPTKRILKTILDLIYLKFMERYSDRPFYAFGALGLLSIVGALVSLFVMLYQKFFSSISLIETPLPLVTVLFFLTGILLFVLGVMAEILARIYHSGLGRELYEIEEIIGS